MLGRGGNTGKIFLWQVKYAGAGHTENYERSDEMTPLRSFGHETAAGVAVFFMGAEARDDGDLVENAGSRRTKAP